MSESKLYRGGRGGAECKTKVLSARVLQLANFSALCLSVNGALGCPGRLGGGGGIGREVE